MLFNSLEFLLFFGVFLFLWPLMRRTRNSRWIFLTVVSLFFYGWWNWRFVFLVLASGMVDFLAGLGMERFPRQKKAFLVISILINIGSLVVFKYLDFSISNINWVLESLGLQHRLAMLHLTLPIGISFYTFQSMSYTIDIYRGQLTPTRNIFHFFAYLSMFPQLVAGPIVRAAKLLPQLKQARKTTEQQRWDGLQLIVYGYCKKVVVADWLATAVNPAFSAPYPLESCSYWWIIILMFAFQIYCDFSGYSDIARGLAKWMGYEFPVNFNHPYIASSLRDFWARWHISLSTWFRDYVYIPLGGGRNGALAAHKNMWLTLLLSSLWHGASWTFVIWGGIHAFSLSIERSTGWPRKILCLPGGRHIATLGVFIIVLMSWTFFRAESLAQALQIIHRMVWITDFNLSAAMTVIPKRCLCLVLIILSRQLLFHLRLGSLPLMNSGLIRALQPLVIAALIVICVYFRGPGSAFIYFQF